jgi:hypothetical protein
MVEVEEVQKEGQQNKEEKDDEEISRVPSRSFPFQSS